MSANIGHDVPITNTDIIKDNNIQGGEKQDKSDAKTKADSDIKTDAKTNTKTDIDVKTEHKYKETKYVLNRAVNGNEVNVDAKTKGNIYI